MIDVVGELGIDGDRLIRQQQFKTDPEWKATTMNIKEFEDLVDLHGEDLSRWPQALRAPAMSLLERSGDARKIVDRAKRLRALLNAAPQIHAPAGLADRIVARAVASAEADPRMADVVPAAMPWYEWMERPLRPALLLSCLAGGLAVGLLTAPGPDIQPLLNTSTIFADFVQ